MSKDFSTLEDSNRSTNADIHSVSDPARRVWLHGGLAALAGGVLGPLLPGCATALPPAPSSSPSTAPLQKASSRWKVAEPRHGTNTATGLSPDARSRRLSTPLMAAETAAESIASSSSGIVGAMTGTLRSGKASSGET